jgi:hypothetical protein
MRKFLFLIVFVFFMLNLYGDDEVLPQSDCFEYDICDRPNSHRHFYFFETV